MRESKIEQHLCKRVEQLGGEVRKVRWIGRNSAPDRRVMLPLPIGPFWVEVKATGEAPTAAQLREHTRMRRAGERVVVIDSYERVEEVLGNG